MAKSSSNTEELQDEAIKIIKEFNKGHWKWLYEKRDEVIKGGKVQVRDLYDPLLLILKDILNDITLNKNEKNKKIRTEFDDIRNQLLECNLEESMKGWYNEADDKIVILPDPGPDPDDNYYNKRDEYKDRLSPYEYAALVSKTSPEKPSLLKEFEESGINVLFRRARIRMLWVNYD